VTATPHVILSTTSPGCSALCEACVPGSYSDKGESELWACLPRPGRERETEN
jgi:hypothetical protein